MGTAGFERPTRLPRPRAPGGVEPWSLHPIASLVAIVAIVGIGSAVISLIAG